MLGLVAHGLHDLGDTVGYALFRSELLYPRRKSGDVAVTARNRDVVAGREYVGADDIAASDRLHERDVGKPGQRTGIANRREPRLERLSCELGAQHRPVRRGFVNGHRDPVVAGEIVAGQVRVHVDQAGQQGPVAQGDDACAAGNGVRIHGHDDTVVDYYRCRADDASGFGIEHAVGRDDQRLCSQRW